MSNFECLNPENCLCQSQFCLHKKGNVCELTGKTIIGTYFCDDFVDDKQNKNANQDNKPMTTTLLEREV